MKKMQIIILAGGQSSRMGSDKAWLKIRESSFIERLLAVSKRLSDHIMIITSDPRFGRLGVPVHRDLIASGGPAAGIHAGLSHSAQDLNLVLSCDLPFLDVTLVKMLMNAYDREDALVCRDDERIHPLAGLYHKRSKQDFEKALLSGARKMTDILETMNTGFFYVPPAYRKQLRNINTPSEYQQINSDTPD